MACGACGSAGAEVFFRSPPLPVLCNELLPTREAALRAPRREIALARCPTCDLIYNAAFDPSVVRYTGAYDNSLHFSPRFRDYAESVARGLVERHGVRRKHVVEIGCGDGAFLALLCRLGDNRGVGFDPAHDGARALALPKDVTIHSRPFEAADAAMEPDLICCRHVLEHVPEPRRFLAAVRRLCRARADAVVFFEVPNALYMLEQLAIWDIVYEHCLYFCAASLDALFRQSRFAPIAVQETYGGQFLTIEARPASEAPDLRGAAANGPATRSRDLRGLTTAFARAHALKLARWRDVLEQVDREGTTAVLWGGGSKGVSFLNMLEVSETTIPYVVDVNPRKQGCHVAGTGQAIIPPYRLTTIRPRLVIVMNPLYREEVEAELGRLQVPATVLVA